MAIPKAVLEQAERAEALQKALLGNTGQPAPEPEAAPQPEMQAEVQPEAAPVAAPAEDPWEVKYKVLAGKYSAEVPRMAEELRFLKEQIKSLEQKPAPVVNTPEYSLTTAEVVEKFGEDFASAVGAVAAQVADSRTAKLREEFEPRVQQVTETAVKSARANFFRELASQVPDWEEIDNDDGFTAFLDEVDDLTGRPRREFFREADHNNDPQRIARFFLSYRGNKSPAPPKRAVPSVERQLAPDSSRSAAPTPPGKKVWSKAEIGQFYSMAQRGRYSAEEYQRIESDIFAAQSENRIAA